LNDLWKSGALNYYRSGRKALKLGLIVHHGPTVSTDTSTDTSEPVGYYLFNAVILRKSTILKTAFEWEIDLYSLWNAVYHESIRSEDLNQFIAGKSLKKLSTRLLYSNERADT
jgi:hypothetical protein